MPKINLSELTTPRGDAGKDRLPSAIMALDPLAREVLLLHATERLSVDKIAGLTGLDAAQVSELITGSESLLRSCGVGADFEPSPSALTRARRLVAAAAATQGPARAALERAAEVPGFTPSPAVVGAAPASRGRLFEAILAFGPSESARERMRTFVADFAAGTAWMFGRRVVAMGLALGMILGAGQVIRNGVRSVADGEWLSVKAAGPVPAVRHNPSAPGTNTSSSHGLVESLVGGFARRLEVALLSRRVEHGSNGPVEVREYSVFLRPTLHYEVRRVRTASSGSPLTSVLFRLNAQGQSSAAE